MAQPHDDAPDGTPSPAPAPTTTTTQPITTYLGYADIEYLRRAEEVMRERKQRTYELMRVGPGQRVLDLGCGPGTDTIPLARLVAPSGSVVGVDHDPAMLAEAARRAQEAGVADHVQHIQADAAALPLEADSFDASRSERLFQHLLDPATALAEMARVTKPGGWVVVLDADWETLAIDTPDPTDMDISRRLVRFRTETGSHNGRAGRQLYRLFKQQRLADVTVEGFVESTQSYVLFREIAINESDIRAALAAGVVTQEELRRWHAALERADADGTFFASSQVIIAAGRKA